MTADIFYFVHDDCGVVGEFAFHSVSSWILHHWDLIPPGSNPQTLYLRRIPSSREVIPHHGVCRIDNDRHFAGLFLGSYL